MKKKSNIILALDVDSTARARKIIKDTKQFIDIYKVGPHLFTKYGPDIVKLIKKNRKEVFLDLKFHDIPNTVSSAIKQAVRLNVYMITLHLQGGIEMLNEAKKAASSEARKLKKKRPLLLGVSVLSSFDQGDLKTINIKTPLKEQVKTLIDIALKVKLDGVVLSSKELDYIRAVKYKKLIKVVPGIRPKGYKKDDQKRIMTPEAAVAKGADFLVIGRPIIKAKSPAQAAEDISKEIS